jgi:hypothetical protein
MSSNGNGSTPSSNTDAAQQFLKQLLAGEKNGVVKKESLKKIYNVRLLIVIFIIIIKN